MEEGSSDEEEGGKATIEEEKKEEENGQAQKDGEPLQEEPTIGKCFPIAIQSLYTIDFKYILTFLLPFIPQSFEILKP